VKLTYKPLEKSDFVSIYRLVEQPGVSQYLVDAPSLGRERLTLWFERSERAFLAGRTGLFGIREVGVLVGFAGLLVLDPLRPDDEYLLYVIDQDFRGRGIATAAGKFVISTAKRTSTQKIIATVDPDNEASVRVMEKLGFADGGLAAGERGDLRLFTLKLK
jgi:RimJ/RimL family protein N-acetyltransferase